MRRDRGRGRCLGLGLLLAIVAGLLVSIAGPAPAAHADEVDDEWKLVRLVNQARADNGLPPLTAYAPIRDIARGQSIRMGQQSRLYHNPDLQADIQAAAPDWQRAGENVGQGFDVESLHNAFMNSPGHRANVLGDYNYLGIGVVRANGYTWVTEVFLKAPGGKPALQAVAPAPPPPPVPVDRIAGASDTDTAVAVASRFPAGSADGVVVGRDDVFADALAGGPLAAVKNGPVLLASPGGASPAVVSQAARVLRPGGTVYLLGGVAALSPAVESAFAGAGLRVERVAGADRYETAVAVARRMSPVVPPSDVLIVSGTNFADAMVAGPVAGRLSAPVLLAAPTGLSPSTSAYLSLLPATRRTIIGGVAAVGEIAASQAGTSDRVAGADRYETSVRVAERWMSDASALSFATGTSFQDALAGAAWSAHQSMPLVLLTPSPSAAVRTYVKSAVGRLSSSTVYGTTSSLSDTAVALAFF